MSENERNICDPVIDTIEESDDEAGSSTHVSIRIDQSDAGQDIGPYNGDSLVGSGSPFKKSYGGSSLVEEASSVDDTLVDEPLPIVSDTLSPFQMDPIHHSSPLPTIQKDTHTFPVSVSDSLPPHVMEMDSPEHSDGGGDRGEDEVDAFCVVNKGGDHPKLSQEVEALLLPPPRDGGSVLGGELGGEAASIASCQPLEPPSHQRKPSQEMNWEESISSKASLAHKEEDHAHSQQDLFESQDGNLTMRLGRSNLLQDYMGRSDVVLKYPGGRSLGSLEGHGRSLGSLRGHAEEVILDEEEVIPPSDDYSALKGSVVTRTPPQRAGWFKYT